MFEVGVEGSPDLVQVKIKTWKIKVFPVTLEEITQKIPPKKFQRMDVDIAWCGSNQEWMNNQFMWFAIGKNEAQGNQIDWIHMSHL